MQSYIQHQTEVSGFLVHFCRFLRQKGVVVGVTEERDALHALAQIPISKEHFFREALLTVLIKTHYHRKRFGEYYAEFWQQYKKATDAKLKELPEPKQQKKPPPQKDAQFQALKAWLNLNPVDAGIELAQPSSIELLTRKDFTELSEEEIVWMIRALQKIVRRIAYIESRLQKVSKRQKQLDIKRTVQKNMRKGGEIQELVFSERKSKKLRLVLLCDVSRSMELYSRFLIHLIYAFQKAHDQVDTYVFSTALHRITEILKNHSLKQAFSLISDRVPQWSGGTTIGTCLANFVTDHAHSALNKKSIVLILSDGWDTGDPETSSHAMQQIHKATRKVIWLNPLAGNPNFSPEVTGLKAVLPYIDHLVAAHNLESLKQLLVLLKKSN